MTSPHDAPDSPRPARWMRFFAARLDRKSYLGLRLTIGLVVIALGLWLFGGLLEEVLDNDTLVRWDVSTAARIHAMATPLGMMVFTALTNVGSPVVMTTLAVAGAVTLFVKRNRLLAYAWAAAVAGGAILDYVLKTTVHRTRPEYAAALLHGSSFSFPSGHAMGSMIGYGFLAYALVVTQRRAGSHRMMVYSAAGLLTLLIGVSRIYIGVHYPSDVVGGWAAGLAWLAFCITGHQVVSGRRSLRSSPNPHSDTP